MRYVPRACGDEPRTTITFQTHQFMFPAPVGMNRGGTDTGTGGTDVPRACGDEPE